MKPLRIMNNIYDFVSYEADPEHGQCPLCGEDGTSRTEVETYNKAILTNNIGLSLIRLSYLGAFCLWILLMIYRIIKRA